MLKSNRSPFPRVPGTGGTRSGMLSPASLPSPTARRRKLVSEKKCASLSASRSPSINSIQMPEDLAMSMSMSMKAVAAERVSEKGIPPLPRHVLAKHLRLLAKKRREFLHMQRMLINQQNTFIDMYAQMRELEEKTGVDPGESIGEVRLISVKDWPSHDLMLLIRDDARTYQHAGINSLIGQSVLNELGAQLSTVPEEVLNVGAELMARRLEILEHLCTKLRAERNNQDWKTKKIEFDTETENLHRLVVETAKQLEKKVMQCVNLARTAWIDREIMLNKIERLQREVAMYQSQLAAPEEIDEPGDKPKPDQNDKRNSPSKTKLMEELQKERSVRESLKHVVSSAENMLRTARARIVTLERQLKDTRAQLETSIRKHKEFQNLHRHRETSYDVRSKKLLEVSKNGEVTIEMLSRQRDALELRVKELQDQTKTLEQDYASRVSEQKSRLESLQAKVTEQDKHRKMAETRVAELEKRLKESQEQFNLLRERSERLMKMEREKCLDYLPRKESEPSHTETEMWKDLQVTKTRLERVLEELRQSRADKDSLLNSLSRIAQEGPENKMATELLHREQKIFNLQRVIDELKENIKSMEDNIAQKDAQLLSLKIEVGRLRNYDNYVEDSPQQDLKLEVLELSTQVASLTRERAALVTAVASRSLMLERHERCADLFAQVTRARRELAAQIEGRSELVLDPSAHPNVNLSNSLSSVCKKAAETWTELRSDRERVLRLQNIVVSQNLQLERECRVRTQLEQRRTILERIFLNRGHSTHQIQ